MPSVSPGRDGHVADLAGHLAAPWVPSILWQGSPHLLSSACLLAIKQAQDALLGSEAVRVSVGSWAATLSEKVPGCPGSRPRVEMNPGRGVKQV